MSTESANLLNYLAGPGDFKEAPLDVPGCGLDNLEACDVTEKIVWNAELDDPAFDKLFAPRIINYYEKKAGTK